MMRFGCGAHVLGHGHRHSHRADEGASRDIVPPREATDPVCGMTVGPSTAKSSVYDRRAYYFCSPECREKFEATPLAYIKGLAVSPTSAETHHGAH